MSDGLLTKENIEYQQRAREVAEQAMRPVAAKYDVAQEYPWEVQHAIRDAGLSGVWIPEEYGGSGAGVLNLCLVVEEFSRACGGMGVGYAVNALGTFPLIVGGTDEQKQRWLPDVASGEKLVAFGLSEKDAGSDAGGMSTRAELDGDGVRPQWREEVEYRWRSRVAQYDFLCDHSGSRCSRCLGDCRREGDPGLSRRQARRQDGYPLCAGRRDPPRGLSGAGRQSPWWSGGARFQTRHDDPRPGPSRASRPRRWGWPRGRSI